MIGALCRFLLGPAACKRALRPNVPQDLSDSLSLPNPSKSKLSQSNLASLFILAFSVAHSRKVKRDSSLRRFYTIDAKNTSDECNLNSSQLTLEPLRGAVQTRCTQKARIGESP